MLKHLDASDTGLYSLFEEMTGKLPVKAVCSSLANNGQIFRHIAGKSEISPSGGSIPPKCQN